MNSPKLMNLFKDKLWKSEKLRKIWGLFELFEVD
jgi:hypothetical protein